MNKISSQDRAALIKLASALPKGSEERKAILAGLSQTAAGGTAQYEKAVKTYGKEVIDSILDAASKLSGSSLHNFLQSFERDEIDAEHGSVHAPGWKPPGALLKMPKNKRPPSALLEKLVKNHVKGKSAALKPADLEALKKVEDGAGMDPKAIGLSVSKIVALEKLGLVHYDRGDGSVLVTNEGRKLLKGKTAAVKTPKKASPEVRRFRDSDWWGWAGAERFEDNSEPFIFEEVFRGDISDELNFYRDDYLETFGKNTQVVVGIADSQGIGLHFSSDEGDQGPIFSLSRRMDAEEAEFSLNKVLRSIKQGKIPLGFEHSN